MRTSNRAVCPSSTWSTTCSSDRPLHRSSTAPLSICMGNRVASGQKVTSRRLVLRLGGTGISRQSSRRKKPTGPFGCRAAPPHQESSTEEHRRDDSQDHPQSAAGGSEESTVVHVADDLVHGGGKALVAYPGHPHDFARLLVEQHPDQRVAVEGIETERIAGSTRQEQPDRNAA